MNVDCQPVEIFNPKSHQFSFLFTHFLNSSFQPGFIWVLQLHQGLRPLPRVPFWILHSVNLKRSNLGLASFIRTLWLRVGLALRDVRGLKGRFIAFILHWLIRWTFKLFQRFGLGFPNSSRAFSLGAVPGYGF